MFWLQFIAVTWFVLIHTIFLLDPDIEFSEVDEARKHAKCPEFGHDR